MKKERNDIEAVKTWMARNGLDFEKKVRKAKLWMGLHNCNNGSLAPCVVCSHCVGAATGARCSLLLTNVSPINPIIQADENLDRWRIVVDGREFGVHGMEYFCTQWIINI